MKEACFIDLTSKSSGEVYIFAARNGRYEIESSGKYPESSPSALSCVSGRGESYLSLPLDLLNFRILRLPFSDREKLLKVIPFELEGLLLHNPEDIVFDASALGSSGDEFEVLVAYIEKGVLKEILAELSLYHIDPPVVTCIELREIMAGDRKQIASRLIDFERPGREERINAARNEIISHTLNLRRGPFAYTKDIEKIRKGVKTAAALMLALALTGNAYLGSGVFAARKESSAMKRELRSLYAGLFPSEKKVTDELYQMKSHMREMREKNEAMVGVYPLQILLDMSARTSPGVSFSEVSMDKDLVTMKGEAPSIGDIDTLKSKMSEFLADVNVSDVKPVTSGKVFFNLSAKGRKL